MCIGIYVCMHFRYLRMNKIFEEHRALVAVKSVEFQEFLKVRIKKFLENLKFYKKKTEQLTENGNIEQLAKYTKKAMSLDNR